MTTGGIARMQEHEHGNSPAKAMRNGWRSTIGPGRVLYCLLAVEAVALTIGSLFDKHAQAFDVGDPRGGWADLWAACSYLVAFVVSVLFLVLLAARVNRQTGRRLTLRSLLFSLVSIGMVVIAMYLSFGVYTTGYRPY